MTAPYKKPRGRPPNVGIEPPYSVGSNDGLGDETESYDRTVCTGPIVRDSIQAANSRELAQINRNARQVFDRIAREAASHDISKAELWHAVGRIGDTAERDASPVKEPK